MIQTALSKGRAVSKGGYHLFPGALTAGPAPDSF